jgi:2,3-bisphosphoglycerate-dependent phosphoglycerate mutase
MKSIYLVRHCEAAGQEAGAQLTSTGVAQSSELADFLEALLPRRIVSSSFDRAVQSIEPLAQRLSLPIEEDDRLVERQLGNVEDGNWREALRASYEDLDRRLAEGESSREAAERGRAAVDEILKSNLFPSVVVTHGNLLSLIARTFDPNLGYEFWESLTNPDVIEIRSEGVSCTVSRIWRDVPPPTS